MAVHRLGGNGRTPCLKTVEEVRNWNLVATPVHRLGGNRGMMYLRAIQQYREKSESTPYVLTLVV